MANMIEPCCAERQLGSILREAGGRAVIFQTQGDVTLEAMMKATMLMAGDRPRVLTIAAQTLPVNAMRTIERYAQLGYIGRLRVMVGEQPETDVFSAFPAEVEVDVAVVAKVPQLLVWQGSTGIVVIQGELPDAVEPGLHLYAGIMGGLQSANVRAAIDPFDAQFRARRVKSVAAPAVDDAEPAPETKKSRKTKKTKDNEQSDQVVEGAQGAEA